MDSDGSGDDGSMEGHLDGGLDSSKNNTSSTSYSSIPKNTASARHVSTTLAATAKLALSSPKSKVSFVNDDHEECCADSGATEHMIPDYKAFVSYKSCRGEFVTLGDTTKLPIMGKGTARFYLNDKVVEVRNALHVPGLRAPLYSLRRHCHMFDCGYYSQFGVGSFILFPTFTIKVDDSEDNIVSFKAIGRAPCKCVDYREPKHPQARPAAHLIPDDDLQHISFHIPDPKARRLPTPPAVSPEPAPTPE
jgi:hypothetical protein